MATIFAIGIELICRAILVSQNPEGKADVNVGWGIWWAMLFDLALILGMLT